MQISGYFVIEATKKYIGYSGSARWVKNKPSLTSREIALQAQIEIPDVFFDRLIPVLKITVPAEAAIQPSVETAIEVTAIAVGEALKVDIKRVEDVLTGLVEEKSKETETN